MINDNCGFTVLSHIAIKDGPKPVNGDFLSVDYQMENSTIIKEKSGTTMGPVDYLVVRFPGNKFSGRIIPELVNLVNNGILRVLDFVFVLKDADGNLSITEAKDLRDEAGALAELLKDTGEWFYEGDIDALAATLENNSSAGILLVENTWAIRFKEALLDANAELIDMGRIPPETIAKVEELTKGGT